MSTITTSNTQLFEGQTTHKLSPEETRKLYAKLRVYARNPDEKKVAIERLHSVIKILNNSPTGVQLLRQMSSLDREFHLDLVGAKQRKGSTALGYYKGGSNTISIRPDLLDHPEHMAAFVAHECLHAVQDKDLKQPTNIAAEALDSENHALTEQILLELDRSYLTPPERKELREVLKKQPNFPVQKLDELIAIVEQSAKDSYKGVYDDHYKKWLNIAKNPAQTPKGALVFKPLKNVPIKQAQETYAREMASLSTRALYIQSFMSNSHPASGKTDDLFQKTISIKNSTDYQNQNYQIPRLFKDTQIPEECVQDMQARNGFVMQSFFNEARVNYGEKTIPDRQTETHSQGSGLLATLKGASQQKEIPLSHNGKERDL